MVKYIFENVLRSEAGSIASCSNTNIIGKSNNLKDWQQFSMSVSFFFFVSFNGSNDHENCPRYQDTKKSRFPHGFSGMSLQVQVGKTSEAKTNGKMKFSRKEVKVARKAQKCLPD